MNEGFHAVAAANIAFLKYWGALNLKSVIPANVSLSMTLSKCKSTCWAQAIDAPSHELRHFNGQEFREPEGEFKSRMTAHLERLTTYAGYSGTLKVWTQNAFPASAGLASSASGFCALTAAVTAAIGKPLQGEQLSEWSRRSGSGSAARSAFGGFVRWPGSDQTEGWESEPRLPASGIAKAQHWDLCDVIALIDSGPKKVSSLQGHQRAQSSPHFMQRIKAMPDRLTQCIKAIQARDLSLLGPIIEQDAIEMHMIAMTSNPATYYWKPGTLTVLEAIRRLRTDGVSVWATMDAGPNVHAISQADDAVVVRRTFERLSCVESVITDRVGDGPQVFPGAPIGWHS